MLPANIRIVLLRTHNGQNLGAIARALNNFGLSRLVLADLQDVRWADARQTAVRSVELLETAERAPSLEAAIEGCSWVVGTTMRRVAGQRDLHPRAVAEELAARSETESVALVFGEERVGLTNEDLVRCHDTSVIPTAQLGSLNLAQAVLLYAWEISQHSQRGAPAPAARADEGAYRVIEAALRRFAETTGFAEPDRPRHGIQDLLQTLKRAGLTPREARLWRAMLERASRPG